MHSALRIFLVVCIAVYLIIIAMMLKKRLLGLRYTLIWLLCGAGMVLFTAFPEIVFRTSALVGISNPVNAIFFLFATFSIVMLISLTSIASTLGERNLRLTQALALLEERVHRLETQKPDGSGTENGDSHRDGS